LDKKPVVLITGCSSGIGLETAHLLASHGCQVFATMRDLKKAGPLRERSKGLSLEVLSLDVDQTTSVQKTVQAVLKKTGRIDVLVNNAGWGAFGAIEEFTNNEVKAQFETNVFGLMRVTRAVLPTMRAQGSGRILNVSSVAGHITFAGIGLYSSTKHVVDAITESLRLELRPFNIQVAAIEPGQIHTQFKDNRRQNIAFKNGKSLYGKPLRGVLEYGDRKSAKAPGPELVAKVIWNALNDRRMSTRYPVGSDARFYPFVQRFLPDLLYDKAMDFVYSRFKRVS
jgi:NAD(P)-dependent dehydrogenase (short-subunit alcohol dehydrogenase family)